MIMAPSEASALNLTKVSIERRLRQEFNFNKSVTICGSKSVL